MVDERQLIDELGLRDRAGHRSVFPIVADVTLDTTTPKISNISPAAGTTIQPATPITFDVTDEASLALQVVFVQFPASDVYDVVFDGLAFAPKYNGSSRVGIPGGSRFTIQRNGGWPASPSFKARAVDGGGNTEEIL